MATYTMRKIENGNIDAELGKELQRYAHEIWERDRETKRLKYDGITITYYAKKGRSAFKGRMEYRRRPRGF